jgi:hypothetical protein
VKENAFLGVAYTLAINEVLRDVLGGDAAASVEALRPLCAGDQT